MQRTLENFGLDPTVKSGPHYDDIVYCSDGTTCSRQNALFDCKDSAHSNKEDMDEANLMIVTKMVDSLVQWAEEYTTNDDYADGYFCILEGCNYESDLYEWVDFYDLQSWEDILEEAYDNGEIDSSEFAKIMEKGKDDPTVDQEWGLTDYIKDKFCGISTDYIASYVMQAIDHDFDCEPHYSSNEWSDYIGGGLCIGGFDIGECEEQVDITCYDELSTLHEQGLLNDYLLKYNGDGYISLSCRRKKNEKTGLYENVGGETYDPYDKGSTTFEFYHSPGGRWDFIIPKDRMIELYRAAVVVYAEKHLEE